ncbi:hypothetical protein AMTR_s00010p00258590 [Amborella trichopoda]|uniref:Gnk2-homologous domain-containing protein n=2 Tax=Amborella trichopoda TaxID=13333 RepID=W1NGU9_AMBTC|nr:hypothetical protein AMTR_s00010p00258590 [Amborella trichopoda]
MADILTGTDAPIAFRCGPINTTTPINRSNNLSSLIDTMREKMGQNNSKFTALSLGQGPNILHGLIQCRLDLSMQRCFACVKNAGLSIAHRCPNSTEAAAWFDDCVVLYTYSNRLDRELKLFGVKSNGSHSENRAAFSEALYGLLYKLSSQVAIELHHGFAVGMTSFRETNKVYAMAECLRNIPSLECERCVIWVVDHLHEYHGDEVGGEIINGSCRVRFESYLFYDDSVFRERKGEESGVVVVYSKGGGSCKGLFGCKDNLMKVLWIVAIASLIGIAFCFCLMKRRVSKVASSQLEDKAHMMHGPPSTA